VTDGRTPRIALASSAAAPEGFGGEPLLQKALAERGAGPEWVVWNDPAADWTAYDLIVLRATWDYPSHIDAFRDWIRHPAVATRVVNPPNVVLPNLHKGYLADLGEVAVPTVVVPAGMTIDLRRLRWPDVVAKPAVGVGGAGAVRVRHQDDLDALTLAPAGAVDVIVQPYLADIERWGETSIVFIGGEPTHAVHKRPAAGEFRINQDWGGTEEPTSASEDELAAGRAALTTLRAVPAYGRVDLIRDDEQRPRVIEMELVEPYLWFEVAPEAADRLASLLMARIARQG
jgi:glutathione synthase/RimK-type ligase-like ATP-grasp enzyme